MKLSQTMNGAIGAVALMFTVAAEAQEAPKRGWGDILTVGACSKDSVPVEFQYQIWTTFNYPSAPGQEKKVLSDAMEPFKIDLVRELRGATRKVIADELIQGTRISEKFLETYVDDALDGPLDQYEEHAEKILGQDVTLKLQVGVIIGASSDTTLPCNRPKPVAPRI